MTAPTGDYLARVIADGESLYGAMAEVRGISRGHTIDSLPTKILHVTSVKGCAWCLTDEQVRPLDQLLHQVRPLDDGDWETPSMRGARYMLAALDLRGLVP